MSFINVVVIYESMTELAQNIVRVKIANRIYFFFCSESVVFLSVAIIKDADEKNKNIGKNKRDEKREDILSNSPLIL